MEDLKNLKKGNNVLVQECSDEKGELDDQLMQVNTTEQDNNPLLLGLSSNQDSSTICCLIDGAYTKMTREACEKKGGKVSSDHNCADLKAIEE